MTGTRCLQRSHLYPDLSACLNRTCFAHALWYSFRTIFAVGITIADTLSHGGHKYVKVTSVCIQSATFALECSFLSEVNDNFYYVSIYYVQSLFIIFKWFAMRKYIAIQWTFANANDKQYISEAVYMSTPYQLSYYPCGVYHIFWRGNPYRLIKNKEDVGKLIYTLSPLIGVSKKYVIIKNR